MIPLEIKCWCGEELDVYLAETHFGEDDDDNDVGFRLTITVYGHDCTSKTRA